MKVGISVILVSLLAVATAGCISFEEYYGNDSENKTYNYTGYNVSFNHTGDYEVVVKPENTNGDVSILVAKGGNFNQSSVEIIISPNIYRSEELAIENTRGATVIGFNKVSNDTVRIDNKTAYVDVFQGKMIPIIGADYTMHQVVLVKDDKIYTFFLDAPTKMFDEEKVKFNVILNSFKSHNTE